MHTSTPDINTLFQSAQAEGLLSQHSLQVLDIFDIGNQIQAALGTPVEEVTSSEVVLVTIMPDDSSSIQYSHNVQAVRAGHNTVLDALASSQQKDHILIHNRYLNGQILYPYGPLEQAVRMDNQNYNPRLGTPLYDQTVILLGTVLAKTQEFADHGVPVRTVTLLITDGADYGSTKATAHSVAALVNDMLMGENHVIAAMGIDDGHTDFHHIFTQMGIRPEWILTPGNNQRDIRQAFQVFSQSALRASQSAAQFKALGGFGN